MKTLYKLIAITLSICFFLIFRCVEIDPTNPYDEDYIGDYRYSIDWDLMTKKENRYIFQPYDLNYENEGNDTLKSFIITHPDSETVDYTIDKKNICLYFKKEYKGKIIVAGIRHNEIEVYDTSETLEVTHPFEITGDRLIGIKEDIEIKIQCKDKTYFSESNQDKFKAVWTLYDTISDTTDWNRSPSYNFNQKGYFELRGGIIDSNKYIYWLGTINLYVPGYRPVIDTAYIENINPYLGDTLRFKIEMNHDNLHDNSRIEVLIKEKDNEIFKSRNITLESLKEPINHQITDTGDVNLTIEVMFNGLSDTTSIQTKINYNIPEPEFSDSIHTIPVRTTRIIPAVDKYKRPETKYIWKIINEGYTDTIQSTELKYYFKKEKKDTIVIFGSIFDLQGEPDTMILDIKKMEYYLVRDLFPYEVEVGDTVEWKVHAVDSTGSQIPENVEYIWNVTDSISNNIGCNTDSNVCKIFIDEKQDFFYVSVYAKIDQTGEIITDTSRQKVYVKKFNPVLYFYKKKYSSLINETVTCRVIVYDVSPGNIEKIYWKLGDATDIDSTDAKNRIWSGEFKEAGTFYLYAWAKDNDGLISDTDSVKITITSKQPQIINLTYDTPILFKRPATFYLETESSIEGGKVVKWFWDFDGDTTTKWDTTTDTNLCSFTFSEFTDTGHKEPLAKCQDEAGIYSPVFYGDFRVDPGFPIISEIRIDKSEIYIRDKWRCIIGKISDPNGVVKKIFFIVNDEYMDTIPNPSEREVFHYTFSNLEDAGDHTVKIEALDDHGFRSSSLDTVITVHLGKPVVDSISIEPGDSDIFINDSILIIVSATDINDTIKTIYISYNEDGRADDTRENIEPKSIEVSFKHKFTVNDTGTQEIKVWVRDNDGVISEKKEKNINVKLGEPKLEGITTTGTIWVVDTNNIGIKASDTNGEIIKFWADWDTDGIWDDSSVTTNRFIHSWDTSFGGQYARFKAKVMDDDHLTTEKMCSLYVRLGRPEVWIDGDTLHLPVTVPDHSDISVKSLDTNGTIESYYFDFGLPFKPEFSNAHEDSIFSQFISANDIDKGYKMAVFVRDNDNLIGGDTVWLFPDGPPPAPETVAPLRDEMITRDEVELIWKGEDVRDGINTQFQILLNDNIQPTTEVLGFGEKKRIRIENVGGENYFKFKYTIKYPKSTTIFWKIIAKDSFGRTTEGSVTYFRY